MSKLYFKIGSDWEEVVRLRNEIAKLKQELMSMDGTQSPAAFKALNAQLAASNQRLDELVTNAAKAGAEMETGFKRKIFDASQVVNGLSEKITFQRGTIQQLKNELSGLKDKYREALKQDGDTSSLEAKIRSTNEKLKEQKSSLFNLTQEQANARLSVKKLRDEYALYRQDGEKNVDVTKQVEQAMSNMGKKLLGGYSIKEFLSSMIRVRGEFQSMQTAIETMVGKDMAGQLIPQIKELAKISPLTMSDMIGAEKMMLGFNIQAEDTIKYLKAISDISMGESSKFNSLTLAFSQMSAAGKLMGQDLNQMINAGFNPLQIISEKTGKSIATLKDEMSKGAVSAEMVQQAFIDATSAGGKFYNMSENASKTINGQLSMMQDALDSVFNELGTKSESVIMDGIQMTTSLIQNYETVGRILAGLVVTYGTYRTAVMLVTAAESKHTLVEIGLTNARLLARKAQLALNAAMLTNPYVLLATAVVGLGVAMWALSDSTTSAERALDSYNKKIEKLDTDEEDRKRTLEGLVSTINSEVEAETTKLKALKDIEELYPALFRKYVDEKGHIQDLTGFWKAYNEEVVKSRTQSKQAIVESLEQQIKSAEWAYNLAKKENNRSEMKVQVQRIEDLKNELANARKDVLSEINAQLEVENRQETKETTYQEDLANAKAEWEKAKKGYEALIKDQTATSKQVKEAKDKMEVSEKTYKELGGVTGSALTRQENLAKKQKENQEKLDGQLLSLHRQNQQDEVSLMKEGTEKKLKQIDLDYQKETDAIKKQRKEWEDAQGGKLTEEQTLVIDLRKELAGKKKDSDTSKVHEEEVKEYQKLLSSYQDYLTKRKNAEDKFNADRKKLKDGGASDAQINELEYQRDETLKSIDNEFAMREDSFKAWTDNIANLSLEKLRELLVQAERELERSEFLNPNDPKLAGQRAKVTSLKNTISEKSEKTNTSPNKRSQKEWQDLYKTLSKVEKEFDEIGKTVGGTAGEIISAAGSIASSTLQMIDGITTLANSSSDAMAGTAQAASKSIQAVEKASVILAIVGAALQITTKMFDLFGSDTTTEKYEEAKEAYQSYINILDKVIDKQLELAESLSGDNAQAAYDRAIELVKTQSEAARVLGKQYLNSGSSWKSHSKGYKEVDDMSAAGWADAAKALGMSVSQFKNAMGGRMTGLFDLTDEQLAKLQEEAHIFWAQLDSDTQNYANQIAEGVAQVKEVLEQQMTDTTLIDVDTLRNDFHDLLTDMDADSADFADNFEDYMRNAILNSMLKESYMGRLEEWRNVDTN
uniref:tape measure protein n=1 Tax=Phocaeicola vulgatus TaxID=821 RepID=UPI003FEF7BB7